MHIRDSLFFCFSVPFVLLLVSVAASSASFVSNVGLVARWSFDGHTTDDAPGHTHNGTVMGNAYFVANRFGVAQQAMYFDGAASYVTGSGAGLPTAARTIAIILKADTVTLTDNHGTLFGYGGGNCGNALILDLNNIGFALPGYSAQGHCQAHLIQSPMLSFDPRASWHLLVYDTGPEGTNLYVNNTLLVHTADFYSNTGVTASSLFGIGTIVGTDGTIPFFDATTTYFRGAIDDLLVYDRVLADSERADLYTYLVTPPVCSCVHGTCAGMDNATYGSLACKCDEGWEGEYCDTLTKAQSISSATQVAVGFAIGSAAVNTGLSAVSTGFTASSSSHHVAANILLNVPVMFVISFLQVQGLIEFVDVSFPSSFNAYASSLAVFNFQLTPFWGHDTSAADVAQPGSASRRLLTVSTLADALDVQQNRLVEAPVVYFLLALVGGCTGVFLICQGLLYLLPKADIVVDKRILFFLEYLHVKLLALVLCVAYIPLTATATHHLGSGSRITSPTGSALSVLILMFLTVGFPVGVLYLVWRHDASKSSETQWSELVGLREGLLKRDDSDRDDVQEATSPDSSTNGMRSSSVSEDDVDSQPTQDLKKRLSTLASMYAHTFMQALLDTFQTDMWWWWFVDTVYRGILGILIGAFPSYKPSQLCILIGMNVVFTLLLKIWVPYRTPAHNYVQMGINLLQALSWTFVLLYAGTKKAGYTVTLISVNLFFLFLYGAGVVGLRALEAYKRYGRDILDDPSNTE